MLINKNHQSANTEIGGFKFEKNYLTFSLPLLEITLMFYKPLINHSLSL